MNPHPQIQLRDAFVPLPEYCVDPVEITAIGLKLGQDRMEKCILAAKERGIRECAVIGGAGVRVHLHPPADLRPPEPWLHEFIKPGFLRRALKIAREEFPGVVQRYLNQADRL